MARKDISTLWDRDMRIAIDENFKELYSEYTQAGLDAKDARNKAIQAVADALTAKEVANVTREEMLAIIREQTQNGDLAPEIAQARQGEQTLGDNLNSIKSNLAQNVEYGTKLSNITPVATVVAPAVSFVGDDAPKNDLELYIPIMLEKNVPFGIAVITDFVGKTKPFAGRDTEYMDWRDLEYVKSVGGELLSHGHTHQDMTILSERDLIDEFRISKKIFSENGQLVDGFVYPHNRYNTNVIRQMRKYYNYAFTGSGDNRPTIRHGYIHRTALGSFADPVRAGYPEDTLSYEYYKARVDKAIENNDWLIFTIHTAHEEYLSPIQQQYLRDIIDYIKSKNVEIISPRDGFKRYGNVLETPNSIIDSQGRSNISDLVFDGLNGSSATKPITAFQLNKVTITPTTQAFVEEVGIDFYPANTAGILKTYYFGNNTASLAFQEYEYISSGSPKKYNRNWAGSAWTDWRSDFGTVTDRINGSSAASPITSFQRDKVTITPTTRAFAEEVGQPHYPSIDPGILTTNYFADSTEGLAYQVYEFTTSNLRTERYTRNWTGSAWTSWRSDDGLIAERNNASSANSPITSFEIGKVTITPTTGNHAQSIGQPHYPVNRSGVLKTYYFGDNTQELAFQKYECISASSEEKFIRNWNGSSWTAWRTQ